MSTLPRARRGVPAAGRRATVFAAATVVAMVDLGVKAWAKAGSPAGIEAAPVDLRPGYNPGVAFSLAAGAPPGVVLTLTAVVTAGVAALVYPAAPSGSRLQLTAFAAVLGGAVTTPVTDRAGDGVVTDYLHSGWWPTFNLADAAIVAGAILLVLSNVVRNGPARTDAPAVARGARTGLWLTRARDWHSSSQSDGSTGAGGHR